ncbi:MAG: type VI secretion system baseplate subunit TssG [Alphaproteobacteria bacterium]|nr:type VI secretion system baseplate subunit TssG [Alphaproteobacteria bacterium]
MAADEWRSDRSVIETLFAEPDRFDLLQAVRLLERAMPGCEPVGEGTTPAGEAVRFEVQVSVDAVPGDISALEPPPGGEAMPGAPAVMSLSFPADLGPALLSFPHVKALRDPEGGRGLTGLFLHRLASLAVRSRDRHRPFDGVFASHLRALAVLSASRPRSMTGLETLLRLSLGVPVRGRQFVGRWLDIAEEERTRLGIANSRLGEDAVLGVRAWSQDDGFELIVGPLDRETYAALLPGQPAREALAALTRSHAGGDAVFSIRLQAEEGAFPGLRLSAQGDARLGWTTRL